MPIDLNLANAHSGQATSAARQLSDARHALLAFQIRLHQHWRGQEVDSLNATINNIATRLGVQVAELESIASLINPAAQEVLRQENLAAAQAVLAREDANVANLRTQFTNAERQHQRNPSNATQTALDRLRTNLNNAIRIRNNAATRVRNFMQ